jgi:hypothetical protein
MGWKIIMSNDDMNIKDLPQYVGRNTSDYNGGTSLVRTGDDDGNIYFIALCDGDNGMERFFDWCMYDSGASWSEYWCTKTNEWKGFIS